MLENMPCCCIIPIACVLILALWYFGIFSGKQKHRTKKQCAECKGYNPAFARFCRVCGAQFEDEEQTEGDGEDDDDWDEGDEEEEEDDYDEEGEEEEEWEEEEEDDYDEEGEEEEEDEASR